MTRVAYDIETHDLLTPVLVALSTLQYHHRLTRDPLIKVQFESMKCVIVFGRSLFHAINGTTALKRELTPIRGKSLQFSQWWENKKKIMKDDGLLDEFRRLRDQLLKEGTLDCMVSMSNGPIIEGGNVIGASGAPEHAKVVGSIIGTQYGGMVYECIRSDGTVEYFPAKLPDRTIFEYKLDKTLTHLGIDYARPPFVLMCNLYVCWWELVVMEILKNYKKCK